jgi:hypothetical protein
MYPCALVRGLPGPRDAVPLLLGLDPAGSIIGYDLVDDTIVDQWQSRDVVALVNLDPAAVYLGVWVESAPTRLALVANRRRRYAPRGQLFLPLPEGELSGFPAAEPVLRRHRMTTPTVDTVRVCSLFAVNTVRIRIELAERQFDCFGDLYRKHGRELPPLEELRECFLGMQNVRSKVFHEVAEYAPVIRDAIAHGYRDRELRHLLAMDTDTPEGLGLAKLSFTLALLGQDTICLDGRLLSRMFGSAKDRSHFEKVTSKREGHYTQAALDAYEALEDAFLTGNPNYDPTDPIGRARAQWQSWEGVGKKGAEHRTWMNLLPA